MEGWHDGNPNIIVLSPEISRATALVIAAKRQRSFIIDRQIHAPQKPCCSWFAAQQQTQYLQLLYSHGQAVDGGPAHLLDPLSVSVNAEAVVPCQQAHEHLELCLS